VRPTTALPTDHPSSATAPRGRSEAAEAPAAAADRSDRASWPDSLLPVQPHPFHGIPSTPTSILNRRWTCRAPMGRRPGP